MDQNSLLASADEPALKKSFPRTGTSYVAQLEYSYMFAHKLCLCNNCHASGFDTALKRCQGCQLNDYCSKSCQKISWPRHKAFCNLVQGKGPRNGYLSAQSREQVFKIIIDSYRLRCELDHIHRHEDHGIYYDVADRGWEDDLVWVHDGDVDDDFQRYLDQLETHAVLPEWWGFETRMELMCLAVDDENKEGIRLKIDQGTLVQRYEGDTQISNALKMVAELAVGYDGKGAVEDDGQWFEGFVKHVRDNPAEKEMIMRESVEAVRQAYEELGLLLPPAGTTT